jgi:hypothetical protein
MKKNSITELYRSLSTNDIIKVINEIEYCETNGSFPEYSLIRELCKRTATITGLDVSSNLMHVQMGVLKEASFRWRDDQEIRLLDNDDLDINLNPFGK